MVKFLVVGYGGCGLTYVMKFLNNNNITTNDINGKDGLKNMTSLRQIHRLRPCDFKNHKLIFIYNDPLQIILFLHKKGRLPDLDKYIQNVIKSGIDLLNIETQYNHWFYNCKLFSKEKTMFLDFNDILQKKNELDAFVEKKLDYTKFEFINNKLTHNFPSEFTQIYNSLYQYFKKGSYTIMRGKTLMSTRQKRFSSKTMLGVAGLCDYVVFSPTETFFNKSGMNIENIKTVYVNTRWRNEIFPHFKKLLDTKLRICKDLRIVFAGTDWTFPNSMDKRFKKTTNDEKKMYLSFGNYKNIKHIYIENLDSPINNKYKVLPLGFNPVECPMNFSYFIKFENRCRTRPLKFTSFNRSRTGVGEWSLRADVEKLCEMDEWKNFYVHTGLMEHSQFLKTMSNYTFTIVVNGGGIDPNPKIYEAMLLGVIPIIIKHEPYTDVYKDMPVIILDETWNKNTFTKEKMFAWYQQCKPYLEDKEKREKVLEFITLEYWWNKICY